MEDIIEAGDWTAAQALIDLRREVGDHFAMAAVEKAKQTVERTIQQIQSNNQDQIPNQSHSKDEGLLYLLEDLLQTLQGQQEDTLGVLIHDALLCFANQNTHSAQQKVDHILNVAARQVKTLEDTAAASPEDRRTILLRLRELNRSLFETATLSNLVRLSEANTSNQKKKLGDLFQRMTNWLVIQQGDPIDKTQVVRDAFGDTVSDFTSHLQHLVTFLHLIDADGPSVDERAAMVQQRRLLSARVLLARVHRDPHTRLHRAVCAACARACDAIINEDIAHVSDILVALATHANDHQALTTISEASMLPEVRDIVQAYQQFSAAVQQAYQLQQPTSIVQSLRDLANQLPIASSPRVEALRAGFLHLASALRTVISSDSLTEIAERTMGTPLVVLEESTQNLIATLQWCESTPRHRSYRKYP